MPKEVPAEQSPRFGSKDCRECVTGSYEYQEVTRSARGELGSLFECGDCGHEVLAV